jgi:cell filamentation protein, protein adenylyltransferase
MTIFKTYLKTHPWISFQIDLRKFSYDLWFQLGEAQAKCEQVAGIPLLPEVANYLHQVFLAKGALATTAIEGNTLSEEDALKLLKGELSLPPSKEYLGQEIENIIAASNSIANKVLYDQSVKLTPDIIKNFNKLVLRNLPLDEDIILGETRQHNVGVGRYKGAPSEDCEYLLEKLSTWLTKDIVAPNERYKVAFGILRAILAHLYIAWIHPFADGNGRTARLVEFQILLSSGVPSSSAHLLSNFYNQTRSEYYRQLDYASKSGGDVIPFIKYAIQGFVDGLEEQIQMIEGQQLHVHWINYVHNQFRNKDSVTDSRRRRLVLDLTQKTKPVPISEIRHVSPRIAEAYAGKTVKTIQRDINILTEMQLVKGSKNGIVVRRDLMSAFLPITRIDAK